MKIAILGYSASGKSTLAKELGKKYSLPVLHLDTVQFLKDWEIRSDEEKSRIIKEFLDTHEDWVIDGTYARFFYERRLEEADEIIVLDMNRFACLFRALKRYFRYRGTTREDIAEGCEEKFDFEFFTWIMVKGRTKKKRDRQRQIALDYPSKTTVIHNQKELDRYKKEKEL